MALVALFNVFVVKTHLHRTKVEPKAKIFFDVCRFFFDIFFCLFTAGAHRALEDQAQVDTRCLINVVASQDIWVSLQVCCYLLLLFPQNAPGPESEDFLECRSWKNLACCNINVSHEIHHNRAVGLYNYHWDRCGDLSPQCVQYLEVKNSNIKLYVFSYLCKTKLENGISHLISITA